MIAGKWFDMVVGVDIHWVLVPAPPAPAPIPTPLPHPFVGVIYDPLGLIVGAAISAGMSLAFGDPMKGPVLINSMPASATGTEGTNKMVMPHIPTPPGVGWAPVPAGLKPPIPGKSISPGVPSPVPSNDAVIITGSKTVYVGGTNATRLGDLAMSCGEPLRLPSSTIIAVPMGAPVLIGGPPTIDFLAAALGAIRTSWVSGRLHKLFNAAEGSWKSKIICFLTGHPVDIVSGMVITDAVDFHMAGPIPVKFERTYYSRSEYRGPLGVGWHHSFDQWLLVERNRIVVRAEDGRDLYFAVPQPGHSVRNHAEGATLVADGAGFVLRTRDLRTFHFAAPALADGRLPLRRIANFDGDHIRIDYDAAGRVARAIDILRRALEFEYGADNRIQTVWAPSPADIRQRVPVARFEYDQEGHLTAAFDALGNPRRYGYDRGLLVSETDRTGFSFYFAYDGIDASARCVRTWGDDGILDRLILYQPEQHVTIVEDSAGRATIYKTNDAGLVDTIIDPAGREQKFEWDDWGRRIGETDARGASLAFAYTPDGRLSKATDPLGNVRTFEWDSTGRCIGMTAETGAAWKFDYEAAVRPSKLIDPSAAALRVDYDRDGNIARTVDRRGVVANFAKELDASGTLQVDSSLAGQPKARASYDAWGRLYALQNGAGPNLRLTRDLRGQVLEAQLSDGRICRFAYDGEGNRVAQELPWGGRTTYRYQALDWLAEIRTDGTPPVSYVRDKEGKLVEINRGGATSYQIERDVIGRITRLRQPGGREQRAAYPDGNTVQVSDRDGRMNAFTYDLNRRLTSFVGWDGTEVSFAYDAHGDLLGATSPDASMVTERDVRGNPIRETVGDVRLELAFDEAGQRVQRRITAGDRVLETRYEWDAAGNPTRLAGDGWQVTVGYDQRGAITDLAFGRAVTVKQESDALRRIVSQVVSRRDSKPWRISYRRAAAGVLVHINDNRSGSQQFRYDAEYRFTGERTENGAELDFARTPAGYLTEVAGAALTITEDGRVERTPAEELSYDGEGRLAERLGTDGVRTRYVYDSLGRLKRVERIDPGRNGAGAVTEVARFGYDAFGRRVSKHTGGRTFKYVWEATRLVLEQSVETGELWEYHYLPGQANPVCRVGPAGVEYLFDDATGRPRAVYDADGAELWHGVVGAYGDIRADSRANGRGAAPSFALPGFFRDPETGLHYGGARYYDPAIARFTSPDPMEPALGPLLYEYPTTPLDCIDFWALYIIGLGRSDVPPRTGVLDQFAQDTGKRLNENISTYRSINDLPILPNPAREGWGKWTEDLIGRSDGARFNMDGIDDVAEAYKRGAAHVGLEQQARDAMARIGRDPPPLGTILGASGAKITDIELFHMLRRDGPLDDALKKFFDANGKEMNIEDLRKKCGI